MKGAFEAGNIDQSASRDTELTLSSTTLLLIFFGLVLLCGLCFGLGYATGRRGTQDTAAALPPASGQTANPESGRAKPPANAAAAQGNTAGRQGMAGGETQSSPVADGGSGSGPVQVKPALGPAESPAQTVPEATQTVAPALASGTAPGALMVQVAAVSQQEDADVLMSALRRRGYAVGGRREPLDGLIHVRIGPFKTRAEADQWRQKLLNDGYNAIVQP
jgi:cell division septation protein DedD